MTRTKKQAVDKVAEAPDVKEDATPATPATGQSQGANATPTPAGDKATPAAGAAGTTPATGATGTTPAAGAAGTTPAAGAPGTTPAAPRKSLGAKEIIPFEWKLVGDSHGMFLTLFKAVDQAEVEAQYERVRKEGYYTNLRVLKAAAKIKQVKPIMPPPASRKAAKTVRKAASAKARKPSVIRLTTAPGKIRKVVAPKKKTSAKTKTATKKAAKKKATKTTKSTKTTKAKKATKATKSTKTTKSVKAKKSTKKKAATAKSAKKATTKKKKAKR